MLVRRALLASFVSLVVVGVAAAPAPAGGPQPDGRVRLKGDPPYIGQGVINDTGAMQTVPVSRDQGTPARFEFRFKNVGSVPGDFVVTGCFPVGYRVRHFVNGSDVTAKLRGDGKTFRDVAVGASTPVVLAKVTAKASVPDGASSKSQCVSAHDAAVTANLDEPGWHLDTV